MSVSYTHLDVYKRQPYVSSIVSWEGKKLLDGGCVDSNPVQQFKKMGYQKNVVVLTREEGFVKKPETVKLAEIYYHRYPDFVETLKTRHEVYNRTLEEIRAMEKTGEVFAIRPSKKLTIGRMESDMEEIQKVYELGRKDAKEHMIRMKEMCIRDSILYAWRYLSMVLSTIS